ncbi:hypothetical protein FGB62_39g115 [Gracilaria domingensis]|nr:hypothetical protein FGB62_39g115 [Gracilaria domingensis]
MSALPAPEYVPPMEGTRSPPQLPNVACLMSYPFRPQFLPLVWPQPVDQEQSDASASSLDITLSTHPVRSCDPLVSEIASRKEPEQSQSMPSRRSFSEPNIAKNPNGLAKPKLPVVQYTSVHQHDESSESSDTADTAVGKQLPMEARIPGVSDRAPTDDDEDDFTEAGDRAVDGATTEAGLFPFFPSLSSLVEASEAATAAAVAKLVVIDSNGDDPPCASDGATERSSSGCAAYGARIEEQGACSGHSASEQNRPLRVALVAVTPLPFANRDAGEHSLHQIRDTMKSEDEENFSTEAVHDKDMSSSEDEEHGRAKSSYDSKRRQKGTSSLLGSVVGKTERALASTEATFASDLINRPMRFINTRSRTPRIKDYSSVSTSKSSSSKSSRLTLPKVLSPKKEKRSFLAREAELEERLSREIARTSDKRTTWLENKYDEDQWDSHCGEADARHRSHERDWQDREEGVQRARVLEEHFLLAELGVHIGFDRRRSHVTIHNSFANVVSAIARNQIGSCMLEGAVPYFL